MHYDFVIVGGGLVGATLANALRETGLRLALIEAKLPDQQDPRLFALHAKSYQFLKNIKVLPNIDQMASPIRKIHVSYRGSFGVVRLDHEEMNLAALGYVIPARLIEEAQNEALQKAVNLTLYRPATLCALFPGEEVTELKVKTQEGEKSLSANFVVAADGAASTVRQLLDLKTEEVDYQQTAIVTQTQLNRSHANIAYERFSSQGVIAMLPLNEQECATIWTVQNKWATELMEISKELFLQQLQKAFGYRLGRLRMIGKRYSYPVKRIHTKNASLCSIVLIGNALHSLSPVAAQGFNLALFEIALLAEAILNKVEKQERFTGRDLDTFQTLMRKQQSVSIAISHYLSRVFSINSSFLPNIMPFALMGLDNFPYLKRRFINSMMGSAARVPRLFLS